MMQRPRKRRPPKHLQKMLFVNHKEELMLQDRLNDLKIKSKLKIMEMDFERRKVKTELRASRKKNIPLINIGGDVITPSKSGHVMPRQEKEERRISLTLKLPERRQSASNITQKRDTVRRPAFEANHVQRKRSNSVQFGLQPSILEVEENEEDCAIDEGEEGDIQHRIDLDRMDRACTAPQNSVGTYVLREFRRMSQVVPSILRALSNKEEGEEEEETIAQCTVEEPANVAEYQPDLIKVTTLANSVKQLRHRMSISKKLEICRPQKSFDQMIKERTALSGEYDEFTDGTCVLMRRRLEKQRRGSEPAVLGQPAFQRRRSIFTSEPQPNARRAFSAVPTRPLRRSRSDSMFQLPTMIQRSSTSLGFGSRSKHGMADDAKPHTINEDELAHRQRVLKELANYEGIKERVERFLEAKPNKCQSRSQYQEITKIT